MISKMPSPFCVFIVLTGILSLGAGQASVHAQQSSRDSTEVAFQQDVTAFMSGHGEVAGAGLGIRSTPEEREATAQYLERMFESLELEPRRHEYRLPNANGLVDLLLPPFMGTNVYAVVGATREAAPFIVIGAHYDSKKGSPGAGDNASGVAVVLSLARKLDQLDSRNFNYLFVCFDQEEDNEVGSKAFVKHVKKRYPDIHSAHITDLSGWDEDGDGVIEVQSPGSFLESRYRLASDVLEIPIAITKGASSDNKSFLAADIRAAGVFGDVTRDLHKPSDTFDKVDFLYMHRLTNLMFEVLSTMPVDGESDGQ